MWSVCACFLLCFQCRTRMCVWMKLQQGCSSRKLQGFLLLKSHMILLLQYFKTFLFFNVTSNDRIYFRSVSNSLFMFLHNFEQWKTNIFQDKGVDHLCFFSCLHLTNRQTQQLVLHGHNCEDQGHLLNIYDFENPLKLLFEVSSNLWIVERIICWVELRWLLFCLFFFTVFSGIRWDQMYSFWCFWDDIFQCNEVTAGYVRRGSQEAEELLKDVFSNTRKHFVSLMKVASVTKQNKWVCFTYLRG